MLEIMTNDQESSAKIIVVGVGGAGNNAVNRKMRISEELNLSVLILIVRHLLYVRLQLLSR